jgi:uncharacterized membrane protein
MSQPVPSSPYYAPTAPDERPYNTISIVAFVLSIVGVSLIGVILGHIGLSQIKTRGERGRGFAIAALVLGYLGIVAAIVAVVLIFTAWGIYSTGVSSR